MEFFSTLQVECHTKENVFYLDVQQKTEAKCEKFEDNCFSGNMIYFHFILLFSYFNEQGSANWCMEYEGKATYLKNIDKCAKMRVTVKKMLSSFFPTYMLNHIFSSCRILCYTEQNIFKSTLLVHLEGKCEKNEDNWFS